MGAITNLGAVALCLVGCGLPDSPSTSTSQPFDTLALKQFAGWNQSGCVENEYEIHLGLCIPACFTLSDSLCIDSEECHRRLLLLTPKSMSDTALAKFYRDGISKRLVVETIWSGKSVIVANVYPSIVTSTPGVLSQFAGMERTGDIVIIKHEAGQTYSWEHAAEYEVSNDGLKLRRIIKTCRFDTLSDSYTYLYDGISPNLVNIDDTIALNCSCDSSLLWRIPR